MQGRVQQEMMEVEDKFTNLIAQGVREITMIETVIIQEVEGGKVASQNFILAWKRRKLARVARDEPQESVGGLLDMKS